MATKRPLSLHHLVAPEITAAQLVRTAGAVGCSFVCLFTQDPAPPMRFPVVAAHEVDELRRVMSGEGVAAYGAASFALNSGTDVADYAAGLDIAARLGAKCANVRLLDSDDERVSANFASFVQLAADRGIVGGIEFMGYGLADALPRALRIIARTGAGGLAVDALHVVRTGASLALLRSIHPARISYLQLCDGPLSASADDYAREGAFDRLAPGEGELPLAELVALVSQHQPISLEVPTARLRERGVDALDRAAHVVTATRRLLANLETSPTAH